MSDRESSSKQIFKSTIMHLFMDGLVAIAASLCVFGVDEVVKRLPVSDWLVVLTGHIERVVFMAVITVFSLKALAEISLEIYGSIKKGLSVAWLHTKRFKWTAASEVFSYAVGIFGFAFIYGLIHRADLVENVLAKMMIYIAAFLLFCEVAYALADAVKDRVLLSAEARRQMLPAVDR